MIQVFHWPREQYRQQWARDFHAAHIWMDSFAADPMQPAEPHSLDWHPEIGVTTTNCGTW